MTPSDIAELSAWASVGTAIFTGVLCIVTYMLAKNAEKIHKDLTIAELQFYNSINKCEEHLTCKPNGSLNPNRFQTPDQEAQYLSSFIDKVKVFYISASDEEMQLRMKMSFISFIDRNQSTFNLEGKITNYGNINVNKKLNEFLMIIDIRE